MKIRVLIVLILINILLPIKSWGETLGSAKFESISIDEGLSNENVTSIFQDSQGYMWIGTQDGLNRYDGQIIRQYNCNTEDTNSLSSTYINDIEEDDHGNIWIATDCGLDFIIKDTDTVVRVKDKEDKYGLGNLKITSILKSSYEKYIMWIGTENGLMRFNIKNGSIEAFYNDENDSNSLTSSYITCLEEDGNNNLWVGTTKGINSIDKNFNIKNYENKLFISHLSKDNSGNMWISTKQGIFRYNTNESEMYILNNNGIEKYDINKKDITSIYTFDDCEIRFYQDIIFNDSKNNLWISSCNGAIKFSMEKEECEIFQKDKDFKYSITSNVITCFYEDSNGTIWIGTDKGVNILNSDSIFNYINMDDESIVSILPHNGYTWIATKFKGIHVYDESNGELVRTINDDENFSLRDRYIKQLLSLTEDYILIVTNKELIVYDTKKDKYIETLVGNDYSTELSYLYNDGQNIWIASITDFYSYNVSSGKKTYYSKEIQDKGIYPGKIKYILQDDKEEDVIWLGGIDIGLIKYHKQKGVMEIYNNNSSDENSLINNYINCMTFDDSGNIWIGTNVGLSKFNVKTKQFTSYTTAEGLTNNFINSILIDDSGDVWISTNKGLNKFDKEDNNFVNYTDADGLYGYQFNLNSSLKLKGGTMMFGSTSGITYFKPEELEDYKSHKNKVVIGDIYIAKDKVAYGEELILEYNYKDLYINYFLPNYESINNINYEYMLEGLDSEWIYLGSRSSLDFKSLEPGKYTLKIRARDGHGQLTEVTSLKMRVKNPIWKTPLAYLVYISIIIGILIYVFNYVKILHHLVNQKTIKLNKQLEENEKLSKEIIEHEKLKNNYFVNLSHELRTPINIIVSTVQLMSLLNKNKKITQEKFNQYMNIISKSCDNLLKVINDIIDSSKIETGKYKIHKKNNDIVYIVEEAALNMSKFIEEKGLSLTIDPDMEEKIIFCDETEIERCIINLLSNAVKFTDEGGEIRLYIKEIEDNIEITVEDTGIGISEEDQDFIFKRFSQVEGSASIKASSSGIGLTLVKYVVELHGGYIRLESEVDKGSKFTIVIPNLIEDLDENAESID